jgi:8-oxo-dGTP pyrophosphatase MutT (NUDIX family)
MHITPEVVRELERRWGVPRTVELRFSMHEREWSLVSLSARSRRTHDVTLFIQRGDELAVIQKPSYPPGVWRAPSGGVMRGERFEDGAVREAWEETGLEVEPLRYLLRAHVEFVCGPDTVLWQTHAFEMRYLGGEPRPVDTREISGTRWATLDELAGPVRAAMLASGSGGLLYRARLQELVAPLLAGVAAG